MTGTHYFRFYTGISGRKYTPSWVFGGTGLQLDNSFAQGAKYLEGTVEAAPQLALQLYIVMRKGLDLTTGEWQGSIRITILSILV